MTAPNDLIPKGLVVVGSRPGEGTAVAQICNHPLVPVANKPLLLYGCEALSRAGVRELGIVASSDAAAELREALADGVGRDVRLTYLEGDQPRGLAEAILRAEAFLDGERFILHPAYGMLRQAIRPFAEMSIRECLDALVFFKRRNGTAGNRIVDLADGRSASLARRLLAPADASMIDVAIFGPRIFEALRAASPAAPARCTTAEAVKRLLDRGGRVQAELVDDWWEHCGSAVELLAVNQMILDEVAPDHAAAELVDSFIQGRAQVHPSARLESTIVRGPVAIGPGANIADSYIGPYTAVGADAVIEGAEIEHSIILPGAVIKHLGRRLEASVVGREARVTRDFALPHALRLHVGDGAEISLA